MTDRVGRHNPSRIWWTQPKLALLCVGVNAVAFGLVVSVSDTHTVEIVALLVLQTMLLFSYATAARRLGVRHLDGRTAAGFDAKIWKKRWNPSRDKYTHPPELIPREDGGSFYRQVLGNTAGGREALYCAMSMWEGARFLWIGNTVALAAAIGFSTIGLTLTRAAERPGFPPLVASALAVPVCALMAPEAINIMLLKRAILRRGATPRTAVLMTRDPIDLGLRSESILPEGVGLEIIIILCIVTGLPILVIVGLAAGLRTATMGAAALVIAVVSAVWFFRAFMRLLVNGIPFLRFDGPVEVSVALDLAHRQRARLSLALTLPPFLYVVGWYSPDPYGPGLLLPFVWFGYLLTVTFGDQLAGYAGFINATHFEECFKRSLAKVQAATP